MNAVALVADAMNAATGAANLGTRRASTCGNGAAVNLEAETDEQERETEEQHAVVEQRRRG